MNKFTQFLTNVQLKVLILFLYFYRILMLFDNLNPDGFLNIWISHDLNIKFFQYIAISILEFSIIHLLFKNSKSILKGATSSVYYLIFYSVHLIFSGVLAYQLYHNGLSLLSLLLLSSFLVNGYFVFYFYNIVNNFCKTPENKTALLENFEMF